MYAHRYFTETEFQVIQYFNGGERVLQPDQHDYLAWAEAGNVPTIEAAGRFISVVDGELVVDPNMDAILFSEAKVAKLASVSYLRDGKIKEGIPYQFPDGPGTIQTRDHDDFRNIAGIATAGIALSGQSPTLAFRDQENVTHELTPAQAVTLGLHVTTAVESFYQAAWVHKDAITAIETMEGIETYDLTVGWPQIY